MRVITPYGLGDAADFDQPVIDVVMGQGSPEPALRLVRYAEAFPLTDFATVRVINLLGRPHSNLQFHSTRKFTQRLLTMPSPPDETTLAVDLAAVDAEIERQRPLVDLGGYIPCPDHRLAPDAEWDLVRYYCDRMRVVFGAG